MHKTTAGFIPEKDQVAQELAKIRAKKKIKVLALCDSPTAATGFAQVARNILQGLAKTGKYEIDVIGINYYGDYYDRQIHPYNIYPAMPQGYSDMYGRGRVMNAITGQEEKFGLKPPWDIVFTIQDSFVIEGLGLDFPFAEQLLVNREIWKRQLPPELWHTWIGYFPVDAAMKENWITRSIALCEYPVAYCDWGKKQILQYDRPYFETGFKLQITEEAEKQKALLVSKALKDRIQVIPHGVDTNVFKPLSEQEKKEFRRQFFKGTVKDNTYLVVNVSRNQPRKDITRTLKVFAEFKKLVPNSHLYLHCKANDAGGSIHEMARNFDLAPGKDYSLPVDFNAGIGYSVEVVNKIYNIADLCITTTLGEGWGFITTEAMAAKTPVVAPHITSIIDIFGGSSDLQYSERMLENPEIRKQLRGIPVKAGSTSSEWICMGLEDNERIRPLTNVDDMVAKMLWAYKHPQEVAEIVEQAYDWVIKLGWQNIVQEWDELFSLAYKNLETERQVGYAIDKAGRNDPCPCGSGAKLKHCHGSSDKLARYRDWLEGGETDGRRQENISGNAR